MTPLPLLIDTTVSVNWYCKLSVLTSVAGMNGCVLLSWNRLELDDFAVKTSDAMAAAIGSHRIYPNYGDAKASRSRQMFGANYERLQHVKAIYDPDCIFNKWFNIEPLKRSA